MGPVGFAREKKQAQRTRRGDNLERKENAQAPRRFMFYRRNCNTRADLTRARPHFYFIIQLNGNDAIEIRLVYR